MRRKRVGMRVRGISENAGNLGGNPKDIENQSGDAGNQGSNLNIAVEVT